MLTKRFIETKNLKEVYMSVYDVTMHVETESVYNTSLADYG